ncbi:hypothetical protein LAX5112_01283 [Roseibium alexandrii]|uniref:Uncharacterized protein n=1 Tax=Roseibium alexandrii TaxID=388408 RepID=A0A0M6ZYF2_9HYPH|nr:hypothetical protein LAX5112_01283 [Roseibium alexandrii]
MRYETHRRDRNLTEFGRILQLWMDFSELGTIRFTLRRQPF